MAKFIGCTVGLECNNGGLVGKMVRVEYSRASDGSVSLHAVNGRTGRALPGQKVVLSAEAFSDRPADPYDDIKEARWALNLVGWQLMAEDVE